MNTAAQSKLERVKLIRKYLKRRKELIRRIRARYGK
jgi:hypothetical protein